jgi:hypothetical protein
VPLLVERAHRNAEQGSDACEAAQRVAGPLAEPAGQNERYAEQAESEAGPLPYRNSLTEEYAGERGRQQRLETPASTPSEMPTKTPPRYTPCTSSPAIA